MRIMVNPYNSRLSGLRLLAAIIYKPVALQAPVAE